MDLTTIVRVFKSLKCFFIFFIFKNVKSISKGKEKGKKTRFCKDVL